MTAFPHVGNPSETAKPDKHARTGWRQALQKAAAKCSRLLRAEAGAWRTGYARRGKLSDAAFHRKTHTNGLGVLLGGAAGAACCLLSSLASQSVASLLLAPVAAAAGVLAGPFVLAVAADLTVAAVAATVLMARQMRGGGKKSTESEAAPSPQLAAEEVVDEVAHLPALQRRAVLQRLCGKFYRDFRDVAKHTAPAGKHRRHRAACPEKGAKKSVKIGPGIAAAGAAGFGH